MSEFGKQEAFKLALDYLIPTITTIVLTKMRDDGMLDEEFVKRYIK